MGFEPMLRVLQTLALPLGHVASGAGGKPPCLNNRAGDGTRTRDLLLGKETFYQLNHARMKNYLAVKRTLCQACCVLYVITKNLSTDFKQLFLN